MPLAVRSKLLSSANQDDWHVDSGSFCRWMHNDLQVGMVGTKVDLTYTYEVVFKNLLVYDLFDHFNNLTQLYFML